MPPLVVEGITDAFFFCGLLGRYLSEVRVDFMDQPGKRRIPASARGLRGDGSALELDFRNQDPETGGRDRIPNVVRALLRDGVLQLAVARDLDRNSPDTVVQSMRDVVSNLLGGPVENISAEKFRVQNAGLPQIPPDRWVTVAVIPMGLHDDPDLKALGITSHAMEDFLIKLLLRDESLRPNVPRFRQLIEELIQTIRHYDVPFNFSKELFQLVKPIIKRGFSDTGVVESLFENADQDILRSVMNPVLDQLDRAAAP